MSDMLADIISHWSKYLQLIVPVGAIILVIVLYSIVFASTPQPTLILADESVSTKKEKALAKKKLKQQQSKKPKPSNGHIVEPAKAPVQSEKVEEKSVVEAKKSNKDKKPTTKVLKKSAPVRDAQVEAALVASRKERAQMKKEALQGEWVTVVSGKEKKAKQAQVAVEQSEKLAEEARQAIIEEALRLNEEAKNAKVASKSDKKSNSDSSIKSSIADKPAKGSKSKNDKKSAQKTEESPPSNIPVSTPPPTIPQPDVRPKDPKPLAESSVAPTPQPTSSESDKSLQEKIAEAMQPAFDELGEWEEAKPMKMKNAKKRARRDK